MPDRIGHGTYLHPEVGGLQESVEFVKKHKIPIGNVCMDNFKKRVGYLQLLSSLIQLDCHEFSI